MCGNGVRALAAFAIDAQLVDRGSTRIKIDTRGGLKGGSAVKIINSGYIQNNGTINVDGATTFKARKLNSLNCASLHVKL